MKVKLPIEIELPDDTPIVPLISEVRRVLGLELVRADGNTVTFERRSAGRASNVTELRPRMVRGTTGPDATPPSAA